MASPTNTSLID